MKLKLYKLQRCRNGKALRKAYGQYLCYCLRNNYLEELQAANNLKCKKLLKLNKEW